jgi:hypothetical protein
MRLRKAFSDTVRASQTMHACFRARVNATFMRRLSVRKPNLCGGGLERTIETFKDHSFFLFRFNSKKEMRSVEIKEREEVE